jgi:hypothetical protein
MNAVAGWMLQFAILVAVIGVLHWQLRGIILFGKPRYALWPFAAALCFGVLWALVCFGIASEPVVRARGMQPYLVSGVLWLVCIGATLFVTWLTSHRTLERLKRDPSFVRGTPRTFAEVDGFISLLAAACEEPQMRATLEGLLSQPDATRRRLLKELIEDMRLRNAPRTLIDAFICLLDDGAAERAYRVIYRCQRKPAQSLQAVAN